MLTESAASGDRLAALRDLRDFLAGQLVGCESKRDVAALAARYQSVLEQVAALEPKKAEGDGIDEIARRRSARRASTAKSAGRAKRSS